MWGVRVAYEHGSTAKRLPEWLRRPIAYHGERMAVERILEDLDLTTVCEEAKCPNRGECFAAGTATFLVAGNACTRGCRFCAVETAVPGPLDPLEPERVAQAVARLKLKHAVVTMVTRDDLADGAAAHIAATVRAIRTASPGTAVELLVSDLNGSYGDLQTLLDTAPDVLNHNVETVPRLYTEVRPGASYQRSLALLTAVKAMAPEIPTKSGLMLGLGETRIEVLAVMRDLREVGCDYLTLGQYLRPSEKHLPVVEFVPPSEFTYLAREGRKMGFKGVASGPTVRSSYHAKDLMTH